MGIAWGLGVVLARGPFVVRYGPDGRAPWGPQIVSCTNLCLFSHERSLVARLAMLAANANGCVKGNVGGKWCSVFRREFMKEWSPKKNSESYERWSVSGVWISNLRIHANKEVCGCDWKIIQLSSIG